MKYVSILVLAFVLFGFSSFRSNSKNSIAYNLSSSIVRMDDTLKLNDLIFADYFSPNNDGHNDEFIILNVENYPNNILKVFNRWGETVYTATPYLNDWTGICTVNGPLIDKQLPEGIYFFEFNDGEGSKVTGKITLKR